MRKERSKGLVEVLAVRLDKQGMETLTRLCHRTGRQRADVVRRLLLLADTTGYEDLGFRPSTGRDDAEVSA